MACHPAGVQGFFIPLIPTAHAVGYAYAAPNGAFRKEIPLAAVSKELKWVGYLQRLTAPSEREPAYCVEWTKIGRRNLSSGPLDLHTLAMESNDSRSNAPC